VADRFLAGYLTSIKLWVGDARSASDRQKPGRQAEGGRVVWGTRGLVRASDSVGAGLREPSNTEPRTLATGGESP